jgi:predicted nucleic acid-binding protein
MIAELTQRAAIRLVTRDAVILEVLAFFAARGPAARSAASVLAHRLLDPDQFDVIEISRELVRRSLDLYASREDKRYSLTDSMSMVICRDLRIAEVLTHDHDFEQEGFTILL